MLKFTTTTPFDINMSLMDFLKIRPLVKVHKGCKIKDGKIKGKEAVIVGKAYEKAGFFLPCFFDGEIQELDNRNGKILMVLPSGEYEIKSTLNSQGIYLLDLK